MNLPTFLILLAPFVLIGAAVFFLRSRPYRRSSLLLALGFSSWAVVFYVIRIFGSYFGGADIGFGIIIFFSPYLTVPLAAAGLSIGRRVSETKAMLVSGALLCVWVALALSYNLSIELKERRFQQRSMLDCDTMPYHCAIDENRISDLSRLKAQGLDIESRDGWGNTALIRYIRSREAVEELLGLGADPEAFDQNGNTALAWALIITSVPMFEVAELLIEHGADVDFEYGSEKTTTALNSAISTRRAEVVRFLLERGADPTIRDGYGNTGCDRVEMYDFREVESLNRRCR